MKTGLKVIDVIQYFGTISSCSCFYSVYNIYYCYYYSDTVSVLLLMFFNLIFTFLCLLLLYICFFSLWSHSTKPLLDTAGTFYCVFAVYCTRYYFLKLIMFVGSTKYWSIYSISDTENTFRNIRNNLLADDHLSILKLEKERKHEVSRKSLNAGQERAWGGTQGPD